MVGPVAPSSEVPVQLSAGFLARGSTRKRRLLVLLHNGIVPSRSPLTVTGSFRILT